MKNVEAGDLNKRSEEEEPRRRTTELNAPVVQQRRVTHDD